MNCRKCGLRVQTCPGCKGTGGGSRHTCSKCANTGQICPSHGGYWT